LFDALSSAFRKKEKKIRKEKGEMARELFPRANMPCWLCHAWILAVRCN
jgi:hypothetical protein